MNTSPATGGRPIIERLQGGHGQVVRLPSSAGSNWTNLYGIATADGSVWATGTFVNPKTSNNDILILRGTGNHWTVDPGPNPGSGSNILGGLTAIDGQLLTLTSYGTWQQWPTGYTVQWLRCDTTGGASPVGATDRRWPAG